MSFQNLRIGGDYTEADHTSTVSLWRPPPFLAIVLKRFFVTERGRRRKLSERVAFPVDGLRLTDFLKCGETEAADSPRNRKAAEAKGGNLNAGGDDVAAPPVYDLVAVVNHFGGLEHGHYTCAARRLDGEGWFEFDDRRVEKLDMGAVCDDPAAYVLFYARRAAQRGKTGDSTSLQRGCARSNCTERKASTSPREMIARPTKSTGKRPR